MIRMDMTQMVRQAVDTAGPDVSVNRDKGDDRSGTDFLRMLRGRQQALDRRETEERLSKKGETRDKPGPADKKDSDAGEPVSGRIPLEAVKADTGDVLKDFTFQFRMDPGQLPEQWDAAVSDAQGSGLWVQVQASAVREDAADALGQEAGQGLPENGNFGPGILGDMVQTVLDADVSPAGQTDGLFKALGKEEAFPVPMAEKSRNQEEPAMVRPAEGVMKPEQQVAGTEQAVPEIPVKAQTRDTMDGNGQPEEELPLAHAVDSHPAVQPKDYGIAAQAGTQSPVRTNMEELPEAFAKTLADRLPERDGTLTIEFEPASLGKVTLRVIYEAGRTSVSLMSDNPKTLEILSQNAGQIAGILEDKTGRETVIYTYQSQQQFGDSREGRREGRREPGEQKDDRRRGQRDSFAQQLRLGLI